MAKSPYALFSKTMTTLAGICILAGTLYFRGTKPKSKFIKQTGIITYLGKTYADLPNRHHGKYRYLLFDGYPRVLELFIGKDPGDFSPNYENLDQLRLGDTITIYYDEPLNEKTEQVNRLAYFIDKGNTAYFIMGSRDKYIAYFVWGFSLLLAVVLVALKRKKIIY